MEDHLIVWSRHRRRGAASETACLGGIDVVRSQPRRKSDPLLKWRAVDRRALQLPIPIYSGRRRRRFDCSACQIFRWRWNCCSSLAMRCQPTRWALGLVACWRVKRTTLLLLRTKAGSSDSSMPTKGQLLRSRARRWCNLLLLTAVHERQELEDN